VIVGGQRVGEETGTRRRLAEVLDDEIADALTGLWGVAKPATLNRGAAARGEQRRHESRVPAADRPALPQSLDRLAGPFPRP
jgi:hypothetical protein